MPTTIELPRFLPFRLNRLASEASEYLAAIYRERFGIDVPEWRILATLGSEGPRTAQQIAASARLHKTRTSRSVAYLIERRLIARAASRSDGREQLLRLTAAGRRLYDQLVPLALERERQLMKALGAVDAKAFLKGLETLERALGLTAEA